jgi:hypothetical protein
MGAMKPPRSRRRLLRDWGDARSRVWLHRPAIFSRQINMGKDWLGFLWFWLFTSELIWSGADCRVDTHNAVLNV